MADWSAIKTEYITTGLSYRKLAEKYGVSATQIANIGKKEGWVKARKRYLSKTVTRAVEKSSRKESKKLAKQIAATQKALDVVVAMLEDEKQFNRHLVEYKVGGVTTVEEKVFDKVDTKALKDTVSALKDLDVLLRNYYNIPTPSQAESQRIAAERLELDRKKSGTDSDGEQNKWIVVLEGAGPEEWNE